MKLKYCGPCLDYSGYGEANRHDIGALHAAGVDLTLQIPRYVHDITDYGRLGELCRQLDGSSIGYSVKIIHTTPDQFNKYIEPNVYHIGRVIWETDKLPKEFVDNANMMDEIWTASETTKKAIENSGVTKPVYVIPEAIDTSLDVDSIQPFKTIAENKFLFYSIFEWTERKNPAALLKAYWLEFQKTPNVGLLIKTYLDNFTDMKKRQVRALINQVKNSLELPHYAPVYLFPDLMNREQVYRFHKTGDCFVSAHRGEGWGIPQMEAMFLGKPVISTDFGGIHDYITDAVDGLLVHHRMVPVMNSRNQDWYAADQQWADVNIDDLRQQMRFIYRGPKNAQKIGGKGRELVLKEFSLESVGQKMRDRLDVIFKNL